MSHSNHLGELNPKPKMKTRNMVNLVPHFLSNLEQMKQVFSSNILVEGDIFLADDDLPSIGPLKEED